MENLKTITNDTYSFFNGQKNVVFVNAHSLRDAGVLFLKRIMKMPENLPVYLEDGKFSVKQTLQNWVNEYGITVFENMEEATGYVVVSVSDTLDHIINTYGWLCVNRVTLDHHITLEILETIANDWGIKDYENKEVLF